jgi:predicted DCC family thiol-disulfide oxidoreductase YuxK
MHKKQFTLIYDSECPVCANYIQMIRIRESAGELTLVSARDNSDLVKEITAMGINLDRGMVLKVDDQIFSDSETIHALAMISSQSDIFNKVNFWIFKSKWRTRLLYPPLRFGRRCLLHILGKKLINDYS